MSALTNAELTQQLQTLQSGMRVIEVTLETIVPKMDGSIQESKSLAEDIKSQLTTHVDPIIKADVIGSLKKLDQNHQLLAQALEKKIQDVQPAVDKMNEKAKNAKNVSEQTATQVLNQARKVEALEPQINAVAQEVAAEKHANQIKYTSTQSQIATMHASNTGPSTGPGKKLHEPLVCHKLMLGKNSLSGDKNVISSMSGMRIWLTISNYAFLDRRKLCWRPRRKRPRSLWMEFRIMPMWPPHWRRPESSSQSSRRRPVDKINDEVKKA